MGRHSRYGASAIRIGLAAAAIGLLTAGACHAQAMGGRGHRQEGPSPESDYKKRELEEQKKKLEADYKAAGERIPERKEKFDPWKNAR